jgi:hypothetical protein
MEQVWRSPVVLDATMLRRTEPNPSLGFAPGSHHLEDSDRGFLTIPGIRWRMPLP